MTLVDTSIWIDLINGKLIVTEPDVLLRFRTTGPILQEVLQGLRQNRKADLFKESFLAIPRLCDPMTWDIYEQAAEIYREGRRRGLTIRSPIDCLIAAVAIENDIPVWHRDRDFPAIASFRPLKLFSGFR